MAELTAEPEVWSTLDFSGLYDKNQQRNEQRRHLALEVLNLIQQGDNLAIDADTGVGKAIVALIVHLSLKRNTLFLVPTVELAYQHYELYKKLKGSAAGCRVMTGNKPPAKRVSLWQDPNIKLVLATPQTIMNDLRQGIFPRGTSNF